MEPPGTPTVGCRRILRLHEVPPADGEARSAGTQGAAYKRFAIMDVTAAECLSILC